MIYLVGNSPLTFYLAAKLQDAGQNVSIMAGRDENLDIETNGVIIREDYNLGKKRYKFQTSFLIKDKPDLVIISCDASKLNHYLTMLSRKTVSRCPLLFLSPIKEIDYIKKLLGNDIIPGYFEGYLMQKEDTIILYGRSPSIEACSNSKKHNTQRVVEIFSTTKIPLTISADENLTYWSHFIPYAAGSLLTTYYNQNLQQLLKDPIHKEQLNTLVAELGDLAKKDLAEPKAEELLSKLYSTPSNYIFPLHASLLKGSKSDVILIAGTLSDLLHKYQMDLPLLSQMIKKIYSLFA